MNKNNFTRSLASKALLYLQFILESLYSFEVHSAQGTLENFIKPANCLLQKSKIIEVKQLPLQPRAIYQGIYNVRNFE